MVTSSILILLLPQPANRTEPTGGVMLPRHILKISITPNWMSLMPRLCAISRKIGVKIRMAGVCHYKRHGGRSRNQKQDDAAGACTAYQNFHKRFYNNTAVENGSYDGCNNNTYGNSADLWKPTRILQT